MNHTSSAFSEEYKIGELYEEGQDTKSALLLSGRSQTTEMASSCPLNGRGTVVRLRKSVIWVNMQILRATRQIRMSLEIRHNFVTRSG